MSYISSCLGPLSFPFPSGNFLRRYPFLGTHHFSRLKGERVGMNPFSIPPRQAAKGTVRHWVLPPEVIHILKIPIMLSPPRHTERVKVRGLVNSQRRVNLIHVLSIPFPIHSHFKASVPLPHSVSGFLCPFSSASG